MRIFVAILADDQTRAYLRDMKQSLSKYKRNLKFVPIDQLHLTLKFLGDSVKEETLDEYMDNLKVQIEGQKKIEYNISKPIFGFPYQNIRKVVLSEIKRNDEIDSLVDSVNSATNGMGSWDIVTKKERMKHINHITLARIKTDHSKAFSRAFSEVLSELPEPDFASVADAVSIIQSTLTKDGPQYKKLVDFKLK